MPLNPTQHPSGYPYGSFTVVWNDIPWLCGMDADDLLWMNYVC